MEPERKWKNNVSVVKQYSNHTKEQLYLLHPILLKGYIEEPTEMFLASIVVEAPLKNLGRCLQDLGSQSTTNDEVFSIYEAYGNAVVVVIILRVSNMGHEHPIWDQRPVKINSLSWKDAPPVRTITQKRREVFVVIVWVHSTSREGIKDVEDIRLDVEVFGVRLGLRMQ